MNKNDEYSIEIVDQAFGGEGIGKVDGVPVFIEFALPGETVKTKILKVNKNYAFGKMMEIEKESDERADAPCPYYYRCGGCDLQHQTYAGQLRFKRKRVVDALERIGKIKSPNVMETIGMDIPFRYRNKAQIPFAEENGKLIAGFYAKRSHRIVDIETCLIQHEDGDRVLAITRQWMEEFKVAPYQKDGGINPKGVVRHVMMRKGFKTGDLMVVLVATKEKVPFIYILIERLKTIEGFKSFVVNVNDKDTNVILGEKNVLLFGQEYIEDDIAEFRFRISPHSFFQINPVQTEVMYAKALEYAALTGTETVFDAYCGAGTISMFLSKQAKKVYGVEIVPEAIEDAKINAEVNKVENVEFILGKSEEVIAKLIEEGIHADVVVVDPPRKGCDPELLVSIAKMGPERMVYVSCDAGTLARDLSIMTELGYRLVEATPVDNFPQTAHVETVVLLSRVES